jgi:hypothetical protein
MTPPLPLRDSTEEFTMLVAITVANTLAPQGKLKGCAYKTEIGIVQLAAVTIAGLKPSQ